MYKLENMNYQKIYNSIVERAIKENRKKFKGIYYEKHHIIPRCMGGIDNNSNLVLLTAKEHFMCHLLLIRIYTNNSKLWYSIDMMANCRSDKRQRSTYEWREKISKANKGRKHTEEEKIKMRKPKKKKNNL